MRSRLFAVLTAALLLAAPRLAAAEDPPPQGVTTRVLEGRIGGRIAGMNLTVVDEVRIVAGHYYFASQPADIPLKPRAEGAVVVLSDPQGGVFRLKLVNEAAHDRQPPTNFYNSTGLAGVWIKDGRSEPAKFDFGTVLEGEAPRRWYENVTDEPDAGFEQRVQRFLRAVESGDRAAASDWIAYPLRVNGHAKGRKGRSRDTVVMIRNRAELQRRWNSVFTPGLRAELRSAIPHEMFRRNGLVTVSDGAVWIGPEGVVAINLP